MMRMRVYFLFFFLGIMAVSSMSQSLLAKKNFKSLAETRAFHVDSIYMLHLENQNLVAIPDSVFLFSNLRTLNLKGNKITEIPDRIGELVNLEYLDIRDNEVAHISPEIRRLKELNTLKLYHNKLDSLPVELLDLPSLEMFDISRNPLTNEALLLVFEMKQLEHLSISKLRLKKLPPEIGNLINLNYLSIFCNQIDTIPESFGKLQRLEVFNGGNNPRIVVNKSFFEIKSLKRMYWVNNKWDSLPAGLEGMDWLSDTYINGNRFSDAEKERVKKIFVVGRLKIED